MSLDARAKIIVEATTRQAVGELRKLDQEAKKSTSGMDSFKTGLATVTAAFGVLTAAGLAAKKIFDFAQEGAQISRLEQAGASLAQSYGLNMGQLVSSMREASHGTISNTDLMLAANRALTLGVADTTEEMNGLLQVAMERGRAMGLSTSQAFSDMVTGVGRLSPMILDNLGIVLNADATYSAYAETIGVNASELTDLQKRQALVNRIMAEAGPVADDAATAYERLGVAAENAWARFKQGLGEGLEPFVEGAADALTAYNELQGAMQTLGYHVGVGQMIFDDFGNVIRLTDEEIVNLADTIGGRGVGSSLLHEQALQRQAAAAEGVSGALHGAASAGTALSQVNVSLADSIAKTLEQIAFMEAGGGQIQRMYEDLNAAVADGTVAADEAAERYNYLGQQATIAAYNAGQASYDEAIAGLEEFGLSAAEALALIEALAQNRTFNIKGSVTMTGGGGGVTGTTRKVSKYARGGDMSGVGVALVGERGPELIINQRHVIDAKTTRALLGAGLPVGSQNMFGYIEDPGEVYEPPPLETVGAIYGGSIVTTSDIKTISPTDTKTTIPTSGDGTTIVTDGGGTSEAIEQGKETQSAITGLAATIPSVISTQMAQQAQAMAETRRQNEEILNELRNQTDLLERLGTATDISTAVQGAVSMVAG